MLLSTFFICISCLTIWSFFASDVLWHFGTALLHDPRLCLINAEHDHAVAFMKSSFHLIMTWVATNSFQFIQSCLHLQIWQESDVIPPWWLWSWHESQHVVFNPSNMTQYISRIRRDFCIFKQNLYFWYLAWRSFVIRLYLFQTIALAEHQSHEWGKSQQLIQLMFLFKSTVKYIVSNKIAIFVWLEIWQATGSNFSRQPCTSRCRNPSRAPRSWGRREVHQPELSKDYLKTKFVFVSERGKDYLK